MSGELDCYPTEKTSSKVLACLSSLQISGIFQPLMKALSESVVAQGVQRDLTVPAKSTSDFYSVD